MENLCVRIASIKLNNFKNVKNGVIDMPCYYKKDYFCKDSDVLGIYGQNGSGKTSVIQAMSVFKKLLSGKPLGKKTARLFSKNEDTSSIFVKLLVETIEHSYFVDYFVEFTKNDESFFISKEKLSLQKYSDETFLRPQTIIFFDGDDILPKSRLKEFSKVKDFDVDLKIAKKLSKINKTSIIFSETSFDLLTNNNLNYSDIVRAISHYAKSDFFVVTNSETSLTNIKFTLPKSDKFDKSVSLTIRLDEPTVITSDEFDILQTVLMQINQVLVAIIPNLTIGIYDFGQVLASDSKVGRKVQLTSKRDDIEIPLNLESEGILKIISVLNILICVYQNRSMCLVIDEFDAGIYEYLLGELVSIFESLAKGQLMFTSHNLRILEMIDRKSVIFSTTNENNRYIRLKHVKDINNLRDVYLRSIALGGQQEEVYKETDTHSIGRAFRNAGKVRVYEKE